MQIDNIEFDLLSGLVFQVPVGEQDDQRQGGRHALPQGVRHYGGKGRKDGGKGRRKRAERYTNGTIHQINTKIPVLSPERELLNHYPSKFLPPFLKYCFFSQKKIHPLPFFPTLYTLKYLRPYSRFLRTTRCSR